MRLEFQTKERERDNYEWTVIKTQMKKRKKEETRWSINLLYNLNKKTVNSTRLGKSNFKEKKLN